MAHNHSHHSHSHSHHATNYSQAFALGIALNLGFVGVEFVFGLLAHSLALVADAGHNLSDVLGLSLAWGASTLARQQPSVRRTYGLRRASILAALGNAVLLLVAVGVIVWEALRRFTDPGVVVGETVVWVAAVGIAVNAGSALLFQAGQKHDLNLRGAFLHLMADAVVSLGTVLAGVLILVTGWLWLDPMMSLAIAVVISWGTWGLLVESLNLALDGVPEQIDPQAVRTYLEALPGVSGVHDLHIWAMSTTENALTAHLVLPSGSPGDRFLAEVCAHLHVKFAIEHTTLQVETGDYLCVLAPPPQV
ncbi:cation diffusion facilitator family transporter [Candidatus Cyanaurora vandensis]|uniref:cation diffusion facilitator family transporter n=1 Tax=Candidatus Cyanaurora vandensis TaxID=2714958 RepID=UPI0037C0DD15